MRVLISILLLVFAVSGMAEAQDTVSPSSKAQFQVSEKITLLDSVGYARRVGSVTGDSGPVAGVFIGTIAELRSGETKMLGFGGILIQAASGQTGDEPRPVTYAVSFVPITFFNDSVQLGFGYDWATDNTALSQSKMVTLGVSLSNVLKQVSK